MNGIDGIWMTDSRNTPADNNRGERSNLLTLAQCTVS